MHRHVFLRGAAAGATALAVPARVRSATLPVKLITVPSQSAANAFYADQRGFFKNSGVDVAVTSMTNGAAIVAAVTSGAADIGSSNPISVAVAVQRGLPLTILAPSSFYSPKAPTSGLVVAENSPLKAAHDLNGKTIAVNGLMNIAQLAVMAWMDQNGGDSKTAHFIEMTFGDMIAGLGSGRIDAALQLEPALTESLTSARILAHAFDAIGPRFYLGVYFTTHDYAKKNPETVARIADGLAKASAWANADRKDADVILARMTNIELPVVNAITHSVYAGKLEAAPMQAPLDVAARYGALAHPVAAKDIMWMG